MHKVVINFSDTRSPGCGQSIQKGTPKHGPLFFHTNTILYYDHVFPIRLPKEIPFWSLAIRYRLFFFYSNDYQLIVAILVNLKHGIIQKHKTAGTSKHGNAQEKGELERVGQHSFSPFCFFTFHCASRTRPFPSSKCPDKDKHTSSYVVNLARNDLISIQKEEVRK